MNFQAAHDIIDTLQVVKIDFLDFVQIDVTRQSLRPEVFDGPAGRNQSQAPRI